MFAARVGAVSYARPFVDKPAVAEFGGQRQGSRGRAPNPASAAVIRRARWATPGKLDFKTKTGQAAAIEDDKTETGADSR